jgi:hypothetical protein
MTDLTDIERKVLEFEHQRWQFAGAKDQAIRETFDLSPTRYGQVLVATLGKPQALEYDAQLVRRLQRQMRARRLALRSSDK